MLTRASAHLERETTMPGRRHDENPLGLGARDRESSNTGSADDTSYDAQGSDPYATGEPRKDFGGIDGAASHRERDGADPDVPSSDEP
jgi:hypothetical protein